MEDTARTGELRRKLEKDPGSRLFAQLAEELRKEGRHDEAISVARKGLEKNPNYPSARLTLSRALLDSGRPAEARPELESIVKASPDNIMASRLLAEAFSELGDLPAALAQFEKTLRISPGDKAVLERIAETKSRLSPAAVVAAPEQEPPPSVPPALEEPPALAVSDAPLPSVFAPDPPPVAVAPEPLPVPALATVPPAPASVALDRDLASGTFSPGSLHAADLQKHFEEVGAASSEPASVPAIQELPAVEVAAVELASVEVPAVELPAEDDFGAATLPLTSVTLADLYLQQGLKAEASAVLSQVIRDEPDNAQARSKFAAVSHEMAVAPAVPMTPAPEPEPPAVSATPQTRAEVRERTILDLKAFASAVEREALQQKATEQGAFR